jgi:Protein of unknown function (DUF4089)
MQSTPPAPDEALLAHARETARGIGLEIPESCAPGVVTNLKTLQQHIDRLMALDLSESVEPAPVFRP